MLSLVTVLVLSYIVGSIPGSLWSSKILYGIDVREHGSGNAGATNTFRVVGWQAGVVATIVDMGKGAFAGRIAHDHPVRPVSSVWNLGARRGSGDRLSALRPSGCDRAHVSGLRKI